MGAGVNDARADPAAGTALAAFEQEEDPAVGPRPLGVSVQQPPPPAHAPFEFFDLCVEFTHRPGPVHR